MSLLDLLRFDADFLLHLSKYLTDLAHQSGLRVDHESQDQMLQALGLMRDDLSRFRLNVSVRHIDELTDVLNERILTGEELRSLHDTIEREIGSQFFLFIPSNRFVYFSTPRERWESVIERFPDAQEDIEEMNKCYALSRYTAAVFHSLLVVEHGLISLGNRIGVTDPKAGWDATYNRLALLLRDRSCIPPDLDFNSLEQTKARLDSMKLAWRNKVNHAAGKLAIEKTGFSDVSAEEVIIACRSFMRHLAEGLPQI